MPAKKTRFTTLDLKASIAAVRKRFLGVRVVNIYDVDNKTYLIKFSKPDDKGVLLIESALRIHTTEFEWPKGLIPSGFAMKLRKHLKSRRLESIEQLGIDRIVDLKFGSGEAAYHLIVELYDKGNIILTDFNYAILTLIRKRTDATTDERFAVNEIYPIDSVKQPEELLSLEKFIDLLKGATANESVKKLLNPLLPFGSAVLDECLLKAGLTNESCIIGKTFDIEKDAANLHEQLTHAMDYLKQADTGDCKGYITYREEGSSAIRSYEEFHPFLFQQFQSKLYMELPTFDRAVDEFFSKIEAQRVDGHIVQKERDALKKLENVKKDHQKRLDELQTSQNEDVRKAHLIEINADLVTRAMAAINTAVANQMSWPEIEELLDDAKQSGDPVARAIQAIKFDINHLTLLLKDPFAEDTDDRAAMAPAKIDVDLSLTAFANAKKYFDHKKQSSQKQMRTIEAGEKAVKSASKRTNELLKEVERVATVIKARKIYWFEKFYWFISSDNYLVLGGRDQQQNEQLVKRYLRPGDLYVHADLHGATSVVIKNPTGQEVPPRTLQESGILACCHSAAWEAKVPAPAYWVKHDQVSKTAPTGEYITTGAFMIRGKRNYLPSAPLNFGFALLFKFDESDQPAIDRHAEERKPKATLDEQTHNQRSTTEAQESIEETPLEVSDDDDDDGEVEAKEEIRMETPTPEPSVVKKEESPSSHDSSFDEDDASSAYPDTQVTYSEDLPAQNVNKQPRPQAPKQQAKAASTKANTENQPIKRGQRTRLKKMKEKYKDQDDEDRQVRMLLLGSAGNEAKKKLLEEQKEKERLKAARKEPKKKNEPKQARPASSATASAVAAADDDEGEQQEDEEEKAKQLSEDARLLATLTGQPTIEDPLTNVIGVCAPWVTLNNYKYKVKVLPGGLGKKGKNVQAALKFFTMDRMSSQMEKDLIKTVKDQEVTRNLPSGKVKFVLPSYVKLK